MTIVQTSCKESRINISGQAVKTRFIVNLNTFYHQNLSVYNFLLLKYWEISIHGQNCSIHISYHPPCNSFFHTFGPNYLFLFKYFRHAIISWFHCGFRRIIQIKCFLRFWLLLSLRTWLWNRCPHHPPEKKMILNRYWPLYYDRNTWLSFRLHLVALYSFGNECALLHWDYQS